MQLTRQQMDRITTMGKIRNWDRATEAQKQDVIDSCKALLTNLASITAIEGVANLSGAKAVLMNTAIKVLNELGAAPADERIDDILFASIFAPEPAATAAPSASAPASSTDVQLPF